MVPNSAIQLLRPASHLYLWLRGRLGMVGLLFAIAVSTHGSALVRIASPVGAAGSHVHPSICVSHQGTLIVIYGHVNHRDLRILRSTDGGATWSRPVPYSHTEGKTFYPGSLTTLSDGRLLHLWNRWDTDQTQNEPRSVVYSLSNDEGRSWGPVHEFPRPSAERSVVRHPIAEIAPNRWLTSLTDRTMIFDAATHTGTALADDRKHGIVPIVITPRGTWVSGAGLRSTDKGVSWTKVEGFPKLSEQGWRHELLCLENGWLLASEILGPGFGGERIRYAISRDDGLTWRDHYEYYNPGRPIGGRACPRTIQLDAHTIGVVFYDMSQEQVGGPGVFFLRIPLEKLTQPKDLP